MIPTPMLIQQYQVISGMIPFGVYLCSSKPIVVEKTGVIETYRKYAVAKVTTKW
jgi:hypothetical protein